MAKKKSAKNAKVSKAKPSNVGHVVFLVGALLAVIAGIFTNVIEPVVVNIILVLLGLIVGFLNISHEEYHNFLVATIALMLAGIANVSVSIIPLVGVYLQAILINITTFVAPAAFIVAIKVIKKLAED